MSDDDNKNWGDKPSREGLGIWQDIRGVPNKFFDSKGDIVLKQNERIASNTERIAEKLSEFPLAKSDSLEPLNEMKEAIQAELVDFNDELSQLNDGSEERHEELMEGVRGIHDRLEDIDDTNRGMSRKLTFITAGTADIAFTARRIEGSLDELNSTASLILETNEGIADGIDDINWALEELTDLTVASIKQQIKTRKVIKQVIREAVERVLNFLSQNHKNLVKETKKLRNAVLAVQQTMWRIEGITQGIREDIMTAAKTSEKIKANQYREQGKTHFTDESFDEAKECFLKAYNLDSTDCETNYYLAKIALIEKDENAFEKFIRVAKKRAITRREREMVYGFAAIFSQINNNKAGIIESGLEILSGSPELFYSLEFQKLFRKIDLFNDFLLPLGKTSNDANVTALCALELGKEPAYARNPATASLIKKLADVITRAELNPFFREKIRHELDDALYSELGLELIGALRDKFPQMDIVQTRKLASLLPAGRNEVCGGMFRETIIRLYRDDPQIARLRKERKYREICDYFSSLLGDRINALKKFGELPKELRSSI